MMLKLILACGNLPGYAELKFPATTTEIDEAFAALDKISTDVSSTIIRDVACSIHGVGRYLWNVDVRKESELERLNRIAEFLDGMPMQEAGKLVGALDMESINGLDDVLRVMENMDSYEFFPDIVRERDLGIFLVESGYMDVPENIRPYLDYRAIGIEYHANHSGAFTGDGYVTWRETPASEMDWNMKMG